MLEPDRLSELSVEEKRKPEEVSSAPATASAVSPASHPFPVWMGEAGQNGGMAEPTSAIPEASSRAPATTAPEAPLPQAAMLSTAGGPTAATPDAPVQTEKERLLRQQARLAYERKIDEARLANETPGGRISLADANLLANSRQYREWRISRLPADLQELARSNPESVDDIIRHADRWKFEDSSGVAAQNGGDEASGSSFGERAWGNVSNFGVGVFKEVAHLGADILAMPAFIEKAGQARLVQAQKAIDAREYSPGLGDPWGDVFYRNQKDLRPTLRIEAKEELDRPLSESAFFNLGDWIKKETDLQPSDERYRFAFELGGGIARGAVEAGMVLTGVGGTTLVIGGQIGNAGFEALEHGEKHRMVRSDSEKLAAENARRNVPIALFGTLPGPNLLRSALSKGLTERFVAEYFRRGGIRLMGAAGDAIESGMMAVAMQVWQNEVAREVYGKPGGSLDGADVQFATAAILSVGLGAARSGYRNYRDRAVEANLLQQRGNSLYVDPKRLLLDHTVDTARIVEDLVRAAPHIEQRATQSGTLDRHISTTLADKGVGEKGWMSLGDARQLMRSGKLSEPAMTTMALRERIAAARESGGDIEISLPDLIKAGLKPADAADIVGSLKFHPRGETVNEVRQAVAAQDSQLDRIAGSLDKADRATVDGSYAFNKIRHELTKLGGGLTAEQVNRLAAQRIVHYQQRLRDDPDGLAGESVNSLYLRDLFRNTRQARADFSVAKRRQAEDDFVGLFLHSLNRQRGWTIGNETPTGRRAIGDTAEEPASVNTEKQNDATFHQRWPESPRPWDYPGFRLDAPRAQSEEGRQS